MVIPSPEEKLWSKIINALKSYAKGQLLLSLTIFCITLAVLYFLGVKYAFILSALSAVLSVIPFFGITISALTAAAVAVTDGKHFLEVPPLAEGMVIVVIYFLINQLSDYVLSPIISGKSTGINPVLLLGAVLAATFFFGIAGTIFAVPVMIVAKTVIEHIYNTENKGNRIIKNKEEV